MNIKTLRNFFGYCTLIGYGVLLIWSIIFRFAHDWHFGIAKLWFANSTVEAYDLVNLAGIAGFKIAIILFFFVPFVSLWIITRKI